MQVNRLPVRVVTRVEASSVGVKLVAEDKVPLGAILKGRPGVRRLGSIAVDEAKVSCKGTISYGSRETRDNARISMT